MINFLFLSYRKQNIHKNFQNMVNTAISKKESTGLKGLFILLVILHHYSHEIPGIMQNIFLGAGALACSGFFFLSGYGLQVSGKYNQRFADWLKKILSMLIPMVVANIFYVAYFAAFREYHIGLSTIMDILGLSSMNHPIWFLWAIIILYFSLYVAMCLKISPLATTIVGGA